MEIKETFFDRIIIPDRAIYNRRLYKMVAETKFIIKGFKVTIINGKIFKVNIRGKHPNANPKSRDFCIPNVLRKLPLNEESETLIHNKLSCFNLDDCYYTPWSEIELKKLEA